MRCMCEGQSRRLFFKLQNYISKMIGDVRVEGEDDW